MRFLMTVNAGGTPPDEKMYAEMGEFVEEMTKAGVRRDRSGTARRRATGGAVIA